MERRRVIAVGAFVWAIVGAGVALSALGDTNADARVLVAVVSIAGPAAAVVAGQLLLRRRDRAAGWFLLVSVLSPTYFAWPLNVPALIVGFGLVVSPARLLPRIDERPPPVDQVLGEH
jgi:hypothetical protein